MIVKGQLHTSFDEIDLLTSSAEVESLLEISAHIRDDFSAGTDGSASDM